MVLVVLGTLGSLYAAYRISKSNYSAAGRTWAGFAPFGVLMIALAVLNILLFLLPMSMRL